MSILLILFLASTVCIIDLCNTTTTTVYLDSNNGTDTDNCGYITFPCKTLTGAWPWLQRPNITGNVTFALKPGNYVTTDERDKVLSHSCFNINQIEVKTEDSDEEVSFWR